MKTCEHLVAECIVVGSGRASPTLFIEPTVELDHTKIKRDILRNISPFHSQRYLHERITSPDHIIIVAPKALPRTATKGNIRRKEVEKVYKHELDRIYNISHYEQDAGGEDSDTAVHANCVVTPIPVVQSAS